MAYVVAVYVHTVSGGVVILMLIVVRTVHFELLLYARHCSKCFASINSFTFHKNPLR